MGIAGDPGDLLSRFITSLGPVTQMRTMVLEFLPTFTRTKSPSFVGKYNIHGAYGG